MLYFSAMLGNSRQLPTTKFGPLGSLHRRLLKHLNHPWRRPPAAFSLELWHQLQTWRDPNAPLYLDMGCGRGLASRQLTQRFPEAQVLGIDKSAHRLRDAPPLTHQLALVRGELEDLIPLMVAVHWKATTVYVLYPNPWPKSTQAKRRWPHHPLFPLLVQLGPVVMRTNWEFYAREWYEACKFLGLRVDEPHVLDFSSWPTTHFEQKYRNSAHRLWEVLVHG